jgi:pimeloyl-ACP methyl ester carboxylesterase
MTLFANFRVSKISGGILGEPQMWDSDVAFAAKPVTPSALSGRTAGRNVLIGIHGFNVIQTEGVASLARLENALGLSAESTFVGVLWPGDSIIKALGYSAEKTTASATGRYLARFCNDKLKDAASLSFVAHSLGARVALEAVRRLNRKATMVCLAAAAIERNCFDAEYRDAFANAEKISILASREDEVLRFAFPLGNLLAHAIDPTANPLSSALGYAGPPSAIGNTVPPWQIPATLGYDHGDYFPHSDAGKPYPAASDPTGLPIAFMRRCFRREVHDWPQHS